MSDYGIAWTSDGLTAAEVSSTVATARIGSDTFTLVCDVGPNRWYIRRSGPTPGRTVVYGSRQAPALRRSWIRLLAESQK